MKRAFFKLLITLVAICPVARCGVWVIIDLPEQVRDVIAQAQKILLQDIQEINEQTNSSYLFAETPFAAHISLAFVSEERLSVQQIEEKFIGLQQELKEKSKIFSPENISDIFRCPSIAYWPGKFEVECGGSKKKHYINAVLKATPNEFLNDLSTDIRNMLLEQYGIKQAHLFSVHATLGKIYQAYDEPIELSQFKEKYIEQQDIAPFIVKEFKLKGHDGSEETFTLSLAQE